MTVKEIFNAEIVDQKNMKILPKYEQIIDAFVDRSLPRPARFKDIIVDSDFDDRYKFFHWVREEVLQPLKGFMLEHMELSHCEDLFPNVKNYLPGNYSTSPRDWHAMAWDDYFDELIFCCYEFEDSVANVQPALMDGFLAHWIDYNKDCKL